MESEYSNQTFSNRGKKKKLSQQSSTSLPIFDKKNITFIHMYSISTSAATASAAVPTQQTAQARMPSTSADSVATAELLAAKRRRVYNALLAAFTVHCASAPTHAVCKEYFGAPAEKGAANTIEDQSPPSISGGVDANNENTTVSCAVPSRFLDAVTGHLMAVPTRLRLVAALSNGDLFLTSPSLSSSSSGQGAPPLPFPHLPTTAVHNNKNNSITIATPAIAASSSCSLEASAERGAEASKEELGSEVVIRSNSIERSGAASEGRRKSVVGEWVVDRPTARAIAALVATSSSSNNSSCNGASSGAFVVEAIVDVPLAREVLTWARAAADRLLSVYCRRADAVEWPSVSSSPTPPLLVQRLITAAAADPLLPWAGGDALALLLEAEGEAQDAALAAAEAEAEAANRSDEAEAEVEAVVSDTAGSATDPAAAATHSNAVCVPNECAADTNVPASNNEASGKSDGEEEGPSIPIQQEEDDRQQQQPPAVSEAEVRSAVDAEESELSRRLLLLFTETVAAVDATALGTSDDAAVGAATDASRLAAERASVAALTSAEMKSRAAIEAEALVASVGAKSSKTSPIKKGGATTTCTVVTADAAAVGNVNATTLFASLRAAMAAEAKAIRAAKSAKDAAVRRERRAAAAARHIANMSAPSASPASAAASVAAAGVRRSNSPSDASSFEYDSEEGTASSSSAAQPSNSNTNAFSSSGASSSQRSHSGGGPPSHLSSSALSIGGQGLARRPRGNAATVVTTVVGRSPMYEGGLPLPAGEGGGEKEDEGRGGGTVAHPPAAFSLPSPSSATHTPASSFHPRQSPPAPESYSIDGGSGKPPNKSSQSRSLSNANSVASLSASASASASYINSTLLHGSGSGANNNHRPSRSVSLVVGGAVPIPLVDAISTVFVSSEPPMAARLSQPSPRKDAISSIRRKASALIIASASETADLPTDAASATHAYRASGGIGAGVISLSLSNSQRVAASAAVPFVAVSEDEEGTLPSANGNGGHSPNTASAPSRPLSNGSPLVPSAVPTPPSVTSPNSNQRRPKMVVVGPSVPRVASEKASSPSAGNRGSAASPPSPRPQQQRSGATIGGVSVSSPASGDKARGRQQSLPLRAGAAPLRFAASPPPAPMNTTPTQQRMEATSPVSTTAFVHTKEELAAAVGSTVHTDAPSSSVEQQKDCPPAHPVLVEGEGLHKLTEGEGKEGEDRGAMAEGAWLGYKVRLFFAAMRAAAAPKKEARQGLSPFVSVAAFKKAAVVGDRGRSEVADSTPTPLKRHMPHPPRVAPQPLAAASPAAEHRSVAQSASEAPQPHSHPRPQSQPHEPSAASQEEGRPPTAPQSPQRNASRPPSSPSVAQHVNAHRGAAGAIVGIGNGVHTTSNASSRPPSAYGGHDPAAFYAQLAAQRRAERAAKGIHNAASLVEKKSVPPLAPAAAVSVSAVSEGQSANNHPPHHRAGSNRRIEGQITNGSATAQQKAQSNADPPPPPPTVSVVTGPNTDARGATIDPATVVGTARRRYQTFVASGLGVAVRSHNKPAAAMAGNSSGAPLFHRSVPIRAVPPPTVAAKASTTNGGSGGGALTPRARPRPAVVGAAEAERRPATSDTTAFKRMGRLFASSNGGTYSTAQIDAAPSASASAAPAARAQDAARTAAIMLKHIQSDSRDRWRAKVRDVYGLIGDDDEEYREHVVLHDGGASPYVVEGRGDGAAADGRHASSLYASPSLSSMAERLRRDERRAARREKRRVERAAAARQRYFANKRRGGGEGVTDEGQTSEAPRQTAEEAAEEAAEGAVKGIGSDSPQSGILTVRPFGPSSLNGSRRPRDGAANAATAAASMPLSSGVAVSFIADADAAAGTTDGWVGGGGGGGGVSSSVSRSRSRTRVGGSQQSLPLSFVSEDGFVSEAELEEATTACSSTSPSRPLSPRAAAGGAGCGKRSRPLGDVLLLAGGDAADPTAFYEESPILRSLASSGLLRTGATSRFQSSHALLNKSSTSVDSANASSLALAPSAIPSHQQRRLHHYGGSNNAKNTTARPRKQQKQLMMRKKKSSLRQEALAARLGYLVRVEEAKAAVLRLRAKREELYEAMIASAGAAGRRQRHMEGDDGVEDTVADAEGQAREHGEEGVGESEGSLPAAANSPSMSPSTAAAVRADAYMYADHAISGPLPHQPQPSRKGSSGLRPQRQKVEDCDAEGEASEENKRGTEVEVPRSTHDGDSGEAPLSTDATQMKAPPRSSLTTKREKAAAEEEEERRAFGERLEEEEREWLARLNRLLAEGEGAVDDSRTPSPPPPPSARFVSPHSVANGAAAASSPTAQPQQQQQRLRAPSAVSSVAESDGSVGSSSSSCCSSSSNSDPHGVLAKRRVGPTATRRGGSQPKSDQRASRAQPLRFPPISHSQRPQRDPLANAKNATAERVGLADGLLLTDAEAEEARREAHRTALRSAPSFEERLIEHIAWRQGTVYGRHYTKMRERLGGGRLDHTHPLLQAYRAREARRRRAFEEEAAMRAVGAAVKGLLLRYKATGGALPSLSRRPRYTGGVRRAHNSNDEKTEGESEGEGEEDEESKHQKHQQHLFFAEHDLLFDDEAVEASADLAAFRSQQQMQRKRQPQQQQSVVEDEERYMYGDDDGDEEEEESDEEDPTRQPPAPRQPLPHHRTLLYSAAYLGGGGGGGGGNGDGGAHVAALLLGVGGGVGGSRNAAVFRRTGPDGMPFGSVAAINSSGGTIAATAVGGGENAYLRTIDGLAPQDTFFEANAQYYPLGAAGVVGGTAAEAGAGVEGGASSTVDTGGANRSPHFGLDTASAIHNRPPPPAHQFSYTAPRGATASGEAAASSAVAKGAFGLPPFTTFATNSGGNSGDEATAEEGVGKRAFGTPSQQRQKERDHRHLAAYLGIDAGYANGGGEGGPSAGTASPKYHISGSNKSEDEGGSVVGEGHAQAEAEAAERALRRFELQRSRVPLPPGAIVRGPPAVAVVGNNGRGRTLLSQQHEQKHRGQVAGTRTFDNASARAGQPPTTPNGRLLRPFDSAAPPPLPGELGAAMPRMERTTARRGGGGAPPAAVGKTRAVAAAPLSAPAAHVVGTTPPSHRSVAFGASSLSAAAVVAVNTGKHSASVPSGDSVESGAHSVLPVGSHGWGGARLSIAVAAPPTPAAAAVAARRSFSQRYAVLLDAVAPPLPPLPSVEVGAGAGPRTSFAAPFAQTVRQQ